MKPRTATVNRSVFMSISIYQIVAEIKNNFAEIAKRLHIQKKHPHEIRVKNKSNVYSYLYPKLEPQPQVVLALGFINLKPDPISEVT